jgi:hypothetical protein
LIKIKIQKNAHPSLPAAVFAAMTRNETIRTALQADGWLQVVPSRKLKKLRVSSRGAFLFGNHTRHFPPPWSVEDIDAAFRREGRQRANGS